MEYQKSLFITLEAPLQNLVHHFLEIDLNPKMMQVKAPIYLQATAHPTELTRTKMWEDNSVLSSHIVCQKHPIRRLKVNWGHLWQLLPLQ